jgi:SPP1 family predicted phage head-tail adaptor
MTLPKKVSTNMRYISASALNSRVSFLQPDAGADPNGGPLPFTTVASNVAANIAMWRGKEEDKTQQRIGQSSYKIIIRYPKNFAVDSGMLITCHDQTFNIESLSDPDMQKVQLEIWAWVDNGSTS